MTVNELIEGVNAMVGIYGETLYTGFCIMLAFSVSLGLKRMVLD